MTITSIAMTALVLSALMALAWLLQARTRNSGWADVVWSYEMGLGGAFLALVPWGHSLSHGWEPPSARQWLVAILVALWSVRLGTHILLRTLRATSEDPRYAELRQQWKDDFQPRLFWFLQVQALAAFVLVLSVGIAAHNPAPGLALTDVLGALVLLGAIFGEGAADQQLKQFAADRANKGRICDIGLWGWSRHPNYFFEWLGWLAYPIIATNIHGYPWGFLSLSGPIFMFVLLRYVSGVPPLEQHMLRKHGGNFAAYQERVGAFFPRPPKADEPR
jgi:steroid 5-alpha reductase family enzyme